MYYFFDSYLFYLLKSSYFLCTLLPLVVLHNTFFKSWTFIYTHYSQPDQNAVLDLIKIHQPAFKSTIL